MRGFGGVIQGGNGKGGEQPPKNWGSPGGEKNDSY